MKSVFNSINFFLYGFTFLNLNKTKKNVGVTLKEHKKLEDDEIAECVQEMGFKITYVMNKDLEQIKDVKEIERISSRAVDILNYMIKVLNKSTI